MAQDAERVKRILIAIRDELGSLGRPANAEQSIEDVKSILLAAASVYLGTRRKEPDHPTMELLVAAAFRGMKTQVDVLEE